MEYRNFAREWKGMATRVISQKTTTVMVISPDGAEDYKQAEEDGRRMSEDGRRKLGDEEEERRRSDEKGMREMRRKIG